ncbi:MAG: DegV family protein [Defluviitaleaceae bacterium]|nr:DegV family protein [Defluviitaleaceae bacterium]
MFQIISDSGCDFTNAEAKQHNVDIIPFFVSFDEKTFLKEGVDISKEEYFERLVADKSILPKTSQPNPQDCIDFYEPHLKQGKDLIVLTISSKLSGTNNSAMLAANMIEDDYPDRKVIVIDSLNGSAGQNLILREIIKMRDAGYSIDKTAECAQEIIKTTKLYFTPGNLEFLKRGGRVGSTTALVGGILGLHPILHLVDGAVDQLDSVRGKKKFQLLEDGAIAALKGSEKDVSICIGHIFNDELAGNFKANIEKALGVNIDTPISTVGAAIGSHIGPGSLVIAYCKKYETFEDGRA